MNRCSVSVLAAAVAVVAACCQAVAEDIRATHSETSAFDMSKVFGGGIGVGGLGGGAESYAGKPKVVLASCCVYPPIGTNVPQNATFGLDRRQGRKGGFSATYLVLAKNIVDIDLDSLVIESITDTAGKNYSKKKNGDANWEADQFRTSVNRENGFAVFSLNGGGAVWAKSLPKVKGRITVAVADKMSTKEFAGKVSAGMIGEGDHTYKVKVASSFMRDEKTLSVSPVGRKASGEIEVFCGGKKVDSVGHMTMNGDTTYNFKKPEGDDIVIKVKVSEGEKKLVLPIG